MERTMEGLRDRRKGKRREGGTGGREKEGREGLEERREGGRKT